MAVVPTGLAVLYCRQSIKRITAGGGDGNCGFQQGLLSRVLVAGWFGPPGPEGCGIPFKVDARSMWCVVWWLSLAGPRLTVAAASLLWWWQPGASLALAQPEVG